MTEHTVLQVTKTIPDRVTANPRWWTALMVVLLLPSFSVAFGQDLKSDSVQPASENHEFILMYYNQYVIDTTGPEPTIRVIVFAPYDTAALSPLGRLQGYVSERMISLTIALSKIPVLAAIPGLRFTYDTRLNIPVEPLRTGSSRIVEGRVLDKETGECVVGATIQVLDSDHSVIADTAGQFRLVLDSSKNPIIRITAPGYDPLEVQKISLRSDSLPPFVVKMSVDRMPFIDVFKDRKLVAGEYKSGNLTGHIRDLATMRPIYGAIVRIMGGDLSASTDSSGLYLIEHVSPGKYQAFLSANGYLPITLKNVTIKAGEITGRSVFLRRSID